LPEQAAKELPATCTFFRKRFSYGHRTILQSGVLPSSVFAWQDGRAAAKTDHDDLQQRAAYRIFPYAGTDSQSPEICYGLFHTA